MSTLRGKTAIVTGASSGIGRAIAIGLAAQGVTLGLVGRDPASLRQVVEAAGAEPSQHRCFRADLTVERDVDELVAAILREFDAVDILVHSAAGIWLGPVETASAEQLDLHYRINLRAPYVLTQGLLPSLKARQGQVLFMNSSASLGAKANVAQYAATKLALKAVADSLREEVNPAGVRVLSLYPGSTASPMQAAVHVSEGRTYRPGLLMQPEDVATLAIQALALPLSAEVTEIRMRPRFKTR